MKSTKPLPCADLEAMLEECDKILPKKYEPTKLYLGIEGERYSLWFAERVIRRAPDDYNIVGKGMTRREAVENLLEKLRSVKK